MQNAPLGLIIPAGAFFEKEFMMLLLFHPAAYYIPINDTPKEHLHDRHDDFGNRDSRSAPKHQSLARG